MDLILKHTVRDYDAWKTVFDEHEGTRAEYGCTGHTVYREADDPNSVTIVLSWQDRQRAEDFTKSPTLREAMERGGVITVPTTYWVEEADSRKYAERRAA